MFENIDKFLMLVELFRLFIPEGKNKDIEEFKKWLILHKHDSLVEVLNNQNQLANHLEGLIRDNSGKLEQQLKDINKMVSSIYARTAIFAPVANTLGIYSDLSEQAISILKQFIESGSKTLNIIVDDFGARIAFLLDGNSNIIFSDDRTVVSDLKELTKYGFVIELYNNSGESYYRPTDKGIKFVRNIPKSKEDKQ
jgi:hypothetical protein